MRKCGADTVSDGGVTIGLAKNRDGTSQAGFGGVSTCASTWCCPQCAAVIAARRADELADVMRAVDNAGGSAFMLTLTVRHKSRDRLGLSAEQRREHTRLLERARDRRYSQEMGDEIDQEAADADEQALDALMGHWGLWDAVTAAWGRVTSGSTWVKDQHRFGGLLGWCRVIETTTGRSGWHTHAHVLLAFAEDAPLEEVRQVAARMFHRWKRALERNGYDASGDMAQDGRIPGWDLRRAQLGDGDLADYFLKLAFEMSSSHRKEGRRAGGRTPMQLLADAVDTYKADDLARWWEWEEASQGRKQLTWSGGRRNLRELAGLGEEVTDEEIVEEELPADDRVGIDAESWGWVRVNEHETTLLDVTETEGIDGLCRWLDSHDLPWIISVPAELRPKRPDGTPLPRPSDRPPRWTDEARAPVP